MKKFLARYYHKGDWWCISFYAEDFSDAEDICRRHSLTLDGQHMFTLKWPWGRIAQFIFEAFR
jgi:hypothetical protein